jgi:hypothetical protein
MTGAIEGWFLNLASMYSFIILWLWIRAQR